QRYSDVNPNNVNPLVLPSSTSTSQLLVDTDGDGNCDDTNPLLTPVTSMITGSNQVLQLAMQAMVLGGSADFTFDSTGVVMPGICDVYTDGSTMPPVALCPAAFNSNFPPPLTVVLLLAATH